MSLGHTNCGGSLKRRRHFSLILLGKWRTLLKLSLFLKAASKHDKNHIHQGSMEMKFLIRSVTKSLSDDNESTYGKKVFNH